MLKKILLETPNEGEHFEEAYVFEIWKKFKLITVLKNEAGD